MSFIFGGDTGLSYDDIKRKRQVADALIARQASNTPRNVGEGLHAIGNALMVRKMRKDSDAADARGRANSDKIWESLFGGGSSYDSPTESLFSPERTEEQEIGDDAMAAIGKPEAMSDQGYFGTLEQQYRLPSGYLSRTAQIESGGNPNAQNPNSSAGGPFQFIDSTAQQYGLTDKTDTRASAQAAARLAADNAAHLRKALGREPTAAELYLAHQQGAGGAAKLLANPNASATSVVGGDAVTLNGGNPNMTAGEFSSLWTGKFGGQSTGAGGSNMAQIVQAMGDPYIRNDPAKMAVVNAMLQQSMQANDPLRQLQLEKAQLELAQMQQPKTVSPGDRYKVVDGQLVDMLSEGGPKAVDIGSGGAPQADFDSESKLRKEYAGLPATKAFSEQAQAFGRIEASAKDPSPAGDLALIFNYMKVLDPGSVVRESEFATAEQATAWLQEMEDTGYLVPLPVARGIRKLRSGNRLSPEQINDFVGRASDLYLQAQKQHNDLYQDYAIRAGEYGLSPERSLPDFRYKPDGDTPFSVRPQARPGTPEQAPAPQASWNGPTADEVRKMDWQTVNAMLSAYEAEDIPDDVLQVIMEMSNGNS